MRVNRAVCACGAPIFERALSDSRWEWAHVDPFAPHDKTLCHDGLAASPMPGTQTNPRTALPALRNP